MMLAIWKKAVRDAVWLLAGCMLAMFGFFWLFVYVTSLVPSSAFIDFVSQLPAETHGLLGISIKDAASWPGRLSLAFIDLTVVLISAIWAIARGSDAVSGPLDRGVLEMVLAQPISRRSLLLVHCTVTVIGAALLSLAAWLGLAAGIATVTVEETALFVFKHDVPLSDLVQADQYILSTLNLFSLTVFVAGLTTLVSACGRYRRITVGIVGAFFMMQLILKFSAKLAGGKFPWLSYTTFLGAYWPQTIAAEAMKTPPNEAWELAARYNSLLIGGAVACYVIATVVFHRRDLPAPL